MKDLLGSSGRPAGSPAQGHRGRAADPAGAAHSMPQRDLPSVVDQTIEPSWPLDVVAQVLVLRQLRAIDRHCGVALLDQDVEGVHKLRVACRRTTAIFETMGKVWRPKMLKPLRKAVADLRRQIGNARDLDVEILRQCARVEKVHDAEEQAVRWLWRRAVGARRHEQMVVVAALEKFESDSWPKRMEKFFSTTPVDLRALAASGKPFVPKAAPSTSKASSNGSRGRKRSKATDDACVGEALPKLIRDQVDAVWKLSQHLDEPLRVVELHSMRLEAKTLRYVLEFFSTCLDGRKGRKLIKTFRRCQGLLGDVHDCDVQAEQMIELIQGHAKLVRRGMRRVSESGAAHAELFEIAHRTARASHDLPAEGLALCLSGLARRRVALHTELVEFWSKLTDENFREGLLSATAGTAEVEAAAVEAEAGEAAAEAAEAAEAAKAAEAAEAAETEAAAEAEATETAKAAETAEIEAAAEAEAAETAEAAEAAAAAKAAAAAEAEAIVLEELEELEELDELDEIEEIEPRHAKDAAGLDDALMRARHKRIEALRRVRLARAGEFPDLPELSANGALDLARSHEADGSLNELEAFEASEHLHDKSLIELLAEVAELKAVAEAAAGSLDD